MHRLTKSYKISTTIIYLSGKYEAAASRWFAQLKVRTGNQAEKWQVVTLMGVHWHVSWPGTVIYRCLVVTVSFRADKRLKVRSCLLQQMICENRVLSEVFASWWKGIFPGKQTRQANSYMMRGSSKMTGSWWRIVDLPLDIWDQLMTQLMATDNDSRKLWVSIQGEEWIEG